MVNEVISVKERRFRKLVDVATKDCPRFSGWVKRSDTFEESIPNTPRIIKGRYFPNCRYKGRILEFNKPIKPFHKATPINEDD